MNIFKAQLSSNVIIDESSTRACDKLSGKMNKFDDNKYNLPRYVFMIQIR